MTAPLPLQLLPWDFPQKIWWTRKTSSIHNYLSLSLSIFRFRFLSSFSSHGSFAIEGEKLRRQTQKAFMSVWINWTLTLLTKPQTRFTFGVFYSFIPIFPVFFTKNPLSNKLLYMAPYNTINQGRIWEMYKIAKEIKSMSLILT